jgi:hypothetical protein
MNQRIHYHRVPVLRLTDWRKSFPYCLISYSPLLRNLTDSVTRRAILRLTVKELRWPQAQRLRAAVLFHLGRPNHTGRER